MPRLRPAEGEMPTPRIRISPVPATSPTVVQIFVVPTSIAAKVPDFTTTGIPFSEALPLRMAGRIQA
jgi:hypothetical protein